MAKTNKRVAARKKSSKRSKASTKPARKMATKHAIPLCIDNPKIGRVYNAEVVGDRIAEDRPVFRHLHAQEMQNGSAELIVGRVAAVVGHVSMPDPDFGRFRTVSTRAREAEWELGTLATDNIVRHSRRAEITTLHEVLWMRPRVPPTPPR
jgi:hypothetical protein